MLAEVLPEEKAAQAHQLKAVGTREGMVGDGMNDAPALLEARTWSALAAL